MSPLAPLAVVEDLDVVEHRVGQLDPGAPLPAVEQFDLHRGPERFDHRVIEAVARTLNNRPRETLDWKTPTEALNEQLLSLEQAGVATID